MPGERVTAAARVPRRRGRLLAVGLQVLFLLAVLYVLHRTRLWRRLREGDGDFDDEQGGRPPAGPRPAPGRSTP
ncbi:hypothetical protein ACFY04_36395 [Streptomyces sp. NPDC001549]|uniref:hypothetical protein n=1 Tax=Streptomyces sp. NPDC001549 TaxID=3364586 RepID=UPI0036C39CDD